MTLTSTMRWLVRPVAVTEGAQYRQVRADGAGLGRSLTTTVVRPGLLGLGGGVCSHFMILIGVS